MGKIKTILVAFGMLAGLNACDRLDVPLGTPACVTSKIRHIKNEAIRNPPAEVWRYEYKGETVYYFPPYCCDMFSDLYDGRCNLIGHPDGGITGQGDGKILDFFTTRTNGILLWKDTR